MRVISLLPAATEIMGALGLMDWLVGVSHECDYPPEANEKPRVTRRRSQVPSPVLPDGVDQSAVLQRALGAGAGRDGRRRGSAGPQRPGLDAGSLGTGGGGAAGGAGAGLLWLPGRADPPGPADS